VARGVVGAIFLVPFMFAMMDHPQILAVIFAFLIVFCAVVGVWQSFVITFGRRRGGPRGG
jgi:hypothetical protein